MEGAGSKWWSRPLVAFQPDQCLQRILTFDIVSTAPLRNSCLKTAEAILTALWRSQMKFKFFVGSTDSGFDYNLRTGDFR